MCRCERCKNGSSWPFIGRGSRTSRRTWARTWVLASTRANLGPGHLATLATPPVLSDTHLKYPSDLGHDSESESEVAEAPQPRTVEAMCKANWPARRRPTEAEWAPAHAHANARGGAGAGRRCVLSVDADAKRVKIESGARGPWGGGRGGKGARIEGTFEGRNGLGPSPRARR
jgi:hypothetical protein